MDSPYWKGPLPGVDVQRRLPVENIPGASRTAFRGRPKSVRLRPGIRVRLQPGMVFGISPESCSASPRNAVRLAPEYAAWPLIVVDYAAIRAAVGLSGQQSLCEMRCIRVIHRRLERWAGDSRPSHYKPVQDRMRASECELPFGPTNPPVAAGQAFSGAASTTNPVQLSINYISVTPIFAGISSAGLYQMNIVTLPSGLGTGDVLLQAIVGGARTPSNVVISLQ